MEHMHVCNRSCANDEFVVGHVTCLDGEMVGRSVCLPRKSALDITMQKAVFVSGKLALPFGGDLTQMELQGILKDEVFQEMQNANESRLRRLDSQNHSHCSSLGIQNTSFEIMVGNSSILDDATIDSEQLLHRLQVRLNNSCIQWQQQPVVFVNIVARTAEGEIIVDESQLTRPRASLGQNDTSDFEWVIFGPAIAGTCSCLCCLCIAVTLYRQRQKRAHEQCEEATASPHDPEDPLPPPALLTSSCHVGAVGVAKDERELTLETVHPTPDQPEPTLDSDAWSNAETWI